MLSEYEVEAGFAERKFLISVIFRERKVSETFRAGNADYVRQSAGYQIFCAICGRTYGKETKAHTDNSHLPIYNANWGFPKRKCLKMAMVEESEYSAGERSTHSSPRTATPFTWRRGTVIVY